MVKKVDTNTMGSAKETARDTSSDKGDGPLQEKNGGANRDNSMTRNRGGEGSLRPRKTEGKRLGNDEEGNDDPKENGAKTGIVKEGWLECII